MASAVAVPAVTLYAGKEKSSRAAADLPEIYGSIIYSAEWAGFPENGLYTIPASDSQSFTRMFETEGVATYGGACKDGVYYMNDSYSYQGAFEVMEAYGYDVKTGALVYKVPIGKQLLATGGMALDPVTNEIYGIFYNDEATGVELASVSYGGDVPVKSSIAPMYGLWNAFAIAKDGTFYGIRTNSTTKMGELCKIDRTTAEITPVGSTGQYPYWQSGACIDVRTNRMFWAVAPQDGSGFLTEVNLETGEADVIRVFEYGEEVGGIYVPAPEAADKAPAKCTDVEVSFADGSFNGSVTLTAPSTLFDGTPGSGDMTVYLLVNGESAGSKSAGWGDAVTFNLDLSAKGDGSYTFTAYASCAGGEGPRATVKNVWIGKDYPAATTATLAYADGNMTVSWLPVTESLHGGYIDLSKLTYTVRRADGSVAKSGLTGTSFSEAVAEPSSLTSYYYAVEAVCDGKTSTPTLTNEVVLGALVPPYKSDFANSGLKDWTVIDANGDGITWGIVAGEACASYSETRDMNDWLISPPLRLEGGKVYDVTFTAHANGSQYPERLEVKYGASATVAGMTGTLFEPIVLNSGVPAQFEAELVATESGVYHIGFHGISDANMYELYVGSLKVSEGSSVAVPGGATELQVTPDLTGKLKANVSFRAPDKTFTGADLESLDRVELLRDGKIIHTFSPVAPGDAVSFDDVLESAGDVTYTVIGYNSFGKGAEVSASAYVGYALPVARNLEAVSSPAGVELKWNAPDLGASAHPVTEDFEDAEAFADKYGDWRFVDLDEWPVGGFQTTQIPGIVPYSTTGSFWVWDHNQLGNSTFAAYSGTKYLFSLYCSDAFGTMSQSDDWAISPELSGRAQTISFYARSYDGGYPETIAVYYSTGSTDPDSFIKVQGAGADEVPGEWTLYEAELPEGAKYFAIVCESYDAFMLMVDDVTYEPVSPDAGLEILGYNLYRDGVKLNDEPLADTEFVDSNVTDGTSYTYAVTVVYADKGESGMSDKVEITHRSAGVNNLGDGKVNISVDGGDIVILNAEGMPVSVASANGAVLFNGTGEARMTVTVGEGIYVVKAGNSVSKLVISSR